MLACRAVQCQGPFRAVPHPPRRAAIGNRARVIVCSSEEDRDMESAFEKELRRRGLEAGSKAGDGEPVATPRSPSGQQQQQGRQQQRSSPRPPPSFRGASYEDEEVPPQLAKSRALNSEGLEGFLPRATELLKLGLSFFLAFGPFILVVSLAFSAIYFTLGDTFVHGGSPSAGPPPYYDPDLLLAEPTADPMVPLDLR